MRFFRRGNDASGSDFWAWWETGRDRVTAAIAAGGFDKRLVDDISRAVRTIHPRMAWELSPGRSSQHAFCISPEGDAELRQVALRWLDTAPAPDATWEYHASRQASPTLQRLRIGDWDVALEEMRAIASWDETRRRLDVRLWHPTFPQLPEQARLQVAFLFLDNLLGEDGVERSVGTIDVLEAQTGGRTPEELRAELQRQASVAAGEETWVLAQGHDDRGGPIIVLANAALKRIDHPFRDNHVSIGIELDGGEMPDDALAAELNAEEDDLLARLGDAAAYAGRTTAPGRRTLHFVTEDLERMRPAIDAWAQVLPPRRIRVETERDMRWAFQKELGL